MELTNNVFHSVRLDKDFCKGCVTCIKFCPTEAIRIRNGKAEIIEERCIDCGECIRRCPNHAKKALTESLTDLKRYKYNIALPAPTLYAQFSPDISLAKIFSGLVKLGFDSVYEVSLAAEYVTLEIEDYLKNTPNLPKPIISSACPAIIRLIQVKFPELIKHLLPILPPAEVAATEAKKYYTSLTGLGSDDIGIWFITPCPAKATNIRQPVDVVSTDLTGAISISSIYGELQKIMGSVCEKDALQAETSSYGVGWGYAGGEIRATGVVNSLIVDSVTEVVDVFEQIEMNKFEDVDYIECLACPGGCIGGALTPENRFVAEKNLKVRVRQMRDLEPKDREETILANKKKTVYSDYRLRHREIQPRPVMKLDDDIVVAMQKVVQMKKIASELPGLDCGACGSPTCASLAEDIVRGLASETDCVFKLRQVVGALAEEMTKISKVDAALPKQGQESTKER